MKKIELLICEIEVAKAHINNILLALEFLSMDATQTQKTADQFIIELELLNQLNQRLKDYLEENKT